MKKLSKIIFFFSILISSIIVTSFTNYKVSASSQIKSKSCYLYDFNSKSEIFAYNENERLPIASMTKIMLLDIVYEEILSKNVSFDEEITISERASSMGGSQVFLESGGVYTLSTLLKSVTVASANDASVALAERFFGSEEECVIKMNEKASKLGLKNTLFCNCTGLPKPMQYSSAKDIALIFADLISYENYFDYSKIWLDKVEHSKNSTEITNTNKLIKFYNGCDGGKTGFTNEAGFCLTATAKRGNMRLISSVIGAPDSKTRFNESSNLLNSGFNNYESIAVLDKDIPIESKIAVLSGKLKQIECVPEKDIFVLSKKGEKPQIDIEYNLDNVCAPIKKGQKVGECIIFRNGIETERVNILSNADVKKMNYFDYVKEISSNW